MPAHIGVINSVGVAAQIGGYLHEISRESSVEVDEVKNELGVTVLADPKPLVTRKITAKGQGDAAAAVTAGAFAADAMKIISAKRTESNDKRPEFEFSAVAYGNLA